MLWCYHCDIRFSRRQPSHSFHHRNRQLSIWCQQPHLLSHHSTASRHRPSSRRWQHTDLPLVEDHPVLWSWCHMISVLSTYHLLVAVVRHLLHCLDPQSSWMQVQDLLTGFPRLLESPGFFSEISGTWKVMENEYGPGKS